jgi:haloalkane dehalogenase
VRGLNAFARGATWMAVEKPLAPLAKRGYLLPYDSWENRIATHEFVADIPLGPGHPSWDELLAIETALRRFRDRPVDLVWGARDWVFTPQMLDEWQRRFPRAAVTRFERAGHYLFEDEHEAFVAALRVALARPGP